MGDIDQLRHTRELYYTSPMSMGKRKRDRQPAMRVTTTDLPTAASHPFYRRLNQLLREHGFDDFVEAQCAGFYAAAMGRPGLAPWDLFPTAADWLLRRVSTPSAGSPGARPIRGHYGISWGWICTTCRRTTRRFPERAASLLSKRIARCPRGWRSASGMRG